MNTITLFCNIFLIHSSESRRYSFTPLKKKIWKKLLIPWKRKNLYSFLYLLFCVKLNKTVLLPAEAVNFAFGTYNIGFSFPSSPFTHPSLFLYSRPVTNTVIPDRWIRQGLKWPSSFGWLGCQSRSIRKRWSSSFATALFSCHYQGKGYLYLEKCQGDYFWFSLAGDGVHPLCTTASFWQQPCDAPNDGSISLIQFRFCTKKWDSQTGLPLPLTCYTSGQYLGKKSFGIPSYHTLTHFRLDVLWQKSTQCWQFCCHFILHM